MCRRTWLIIYLFEPVVCAFLKGIKGFSAFYWNFHQWTWTSWAICSNVFILITLWPKQKGCDLSSDPDLLFITAYYQRKQFYGYFGCDSDTVKLRADNITICHIVAINVIFCNKYKILMEPLSIKHMLQTLVQGHQKQKKKSLHFLFVYFKGCTSCHGYILSSCYFQP